jgi:hypothetical protein
MTRSQIFTAAHKLAKTFTGDYSACFALALTEVYASLKAPKTTTKVLKFSDFAKRFQSDFYFGDENETEEYQIIEFKEFAMNLVKAGKSISYKFIGKDVELTIAA